MEILSEGTNQDKLCKNDFKIAKWYIYIYIMIA